MEFSIRAFYSRGESVADAVQARLNGDLTGSFAQYFSNIDFSKFRPGVDPAQLLRMLTWMTEGLSLIHIFIFFCKAAVHPWRMCGCFFIFSLLRQVHRKNAQNRDRKSVV